MGATLRTRPACWTLWLDFSSAGPNYDLLSFLLSYSYPTLPTFYANMLLYSEYPSNSFSSL